MYIVACVMSFRYEFDVTKSMFSAGNITEKLRIASFDCRGETVVDLYAGRKIVSVHSDHNSIFLYIFILTLKCV